MNTITILGMTYFHAFTIIATASILLFSWPIATAFYRSKLKKMTQKFGPIRFRAQTEQPNVIAKVISIPRTLTLILELSILFLTILDTKCSLFIFSAFVFVLYSEYFHVLGYNNGLVDLGLIKCGSYIPRKKIQSWSINANGSILIETEQTGMIPHGRNFGGQRKLIPLKATWDFCKSNPSVISYFRSNEKMKEKEKKEENEKNGYNDSER